MSAHPPLRKARILGSPHGFELLRPIVRTERLIVLKAATDGRPLVYDRDGSSYEADLPFKSWIHPDDVAAIKSEPPR